MNVKELLDKFHEDLRGRLKEIDDERAQILVILQNGKVVEERRPKPPPGGVWTPERRKAQARRMRRLHRDGKFR